MTIVAFLLLVMCEPYQRPSEPNRTYLGRSGGHEVYSRKVEGGILYEYHYEDAMTFNQKARGFRVIFISDSGQQANSENTQEN